MSYYLDGSDNSTSKSSASTNHGSLSSNSHFGPNNLCVQNNVLRDSSQLNVASTTVECTVSYNSNNHGTTEMHCALPSSHTVAAPVVPAASIRTVTKLPTSVSTHNGTLSKSSLITVLNAPLSNVKTLCVTPAISSTGNVAPNSSTGLPVVESMNNAITVGSSYANASSVHTKPQTITLLNAPMTVVKPVLNNTYSHNADKHLTTLDPHLNATENRGHNVFVKNTSRSVHGDDGCGNQSSKFAYNHGMDGCKLVTQSALTSGNSGQLIIPRNNAKVKIVSNLVISGPGSNSHLQTYNISNKIQNNAPSRCISHIGSNNAVKQRSSSHTLSQANGCTSTSNTISTSAASTVLYSPKMINKTTQHMKNSGINSFKQQLLERTPQTNNRSTITYGTHAKSQGKNNSASYVYQGLKTIQAKNANDIITHGCNMTASRSVPSTPPSLSSSSNITNCNIRALPSQQRSLHISSTCGNKFSTQPKTNYIGKYALQSQKLKVHSRIRNCKSAPSKGYNVYPLSPFTHSSVHQQIHNPSANEKQITFNQALTAEIIETLGNQSSVLMKQAVNSHSQTEVSPKYNTQSYHNHIKSEPCHASRENTYNGDSIFSHREDQCSETKSGLDALSFICQAVLLDHNYNATLPVDSSNNSRNIVPSSSVISSNSTNSVASSCSISGSPCSTSLSAHTSSLNPGGNSILSTTYKPQTSNSLRQRTRLNPQLNSLQKSPVSQSLTSYSQVQQNNQVLQHHPSSIADQDTASSDISDVSDLENKHDSEGEETDTAPEAEAETEAVKNEDQFGDYVTRCICGFVHDDGYMVECDRCKVWQHVQCVVKNKEIPDVYLCDICDPFKKFDRAKARIIQQQWLKERQVIEEKMRKDNKLLLRRSNNTHSRGTQNNVIPRNATNAHGRKSEDTDDADADDDDDADDDRSSDTEQPPVRASVIKKTERQKQKPLVRAKSSRQVLNNRRKLNNHTRSRRENPLLSNGKRQAMKKRERKLRRKPKSTRLQLQQNNVIGQTDAETQNNVEHNMPQLRQWIENYEEAVTNHYSPELRARISSIRVNGIQQSNDNCLPVQSHYDTSVHHCRVHTQPLTQLKYLVTSVLLPPNTPVIELRGKYMLSTQHRSACASGNVSNATGSGGATITIGGSSAMSTRQQSNAQRPGPFLFFYRLHKDNTEVCVDTRTYGNSARFIRRSCKPNSELRHCMEKGVLHLYIVTTTTVEENIELTIKHESHDLAISGSTHIACACGVPSECTINKVTNQKTVQTNNQSISNRKNGSIQEVRKRRSRRNLSSRKPISPVKVLPKLEDTQFIPPEHCLDRVDKNCSVSPEKSTADIKSNEKLKPEIDLTLVKNETICNDEAKNEPVVKNEPTEITELCDKNLKKHEDFTVSKDCVKEEILDESEIQKPKNEKLDHIFKSEQPDDERYSCIEEPTSKLTITTRRSSQQQKSVSSDKDSDSMDDEKRKCRSTGDNQTISTNARSKDQNKKPSREERKLEAILRAIAQMEKAEHKKQEIQAKQQQHRRESESNPEKDEKENNKAHTPTIIDTMDEVTDNQSPICETKIKRKRKRTRAKLSNMSLQNSCKARLSSDSNQYQTSDDESVSSTTDNQQKSQGDMVTSPENRTNNFYDNHSPQKDAGLLLSLASNNSRLAEKFSDLPMDKPFSGLLTNSNANHLSDLNQHTTLSPACLLVQAAVEPLDISGQLRLPKTKKGLMNEWLHNRSPDHTSTELESSNLFSDNTCGKNSLSALAQVASFCGTVHDPLTQTPHRISDQLSGCSAKKRWLRKAINEDHQQLNLVDSSCTNTTDFSNHNDGTQTGFTAAAPPKKRRIPTHEDNSDNRTPPTTPTTQENTPIFSSPSATLCRDLSEIDVYCDESCERYSCKKQYYSNDSLNEDDDTNVDADISESSATYISDDHKNVKDTVNSSCLLDPRLNRNTHVLGQGENLVGAVEKSLSMLGFSDTGSASLKSNTLNTERTKRKLSITEYRQRKKINNGEYADKNSDELGMLANEDANSMESISIQNDGLISDLQPVRVGASNTTVGATALPINRSRTLSISSSRASERSQSVPSSPTSFTTSASDDEDHISGNMQIHGGQSHAATASCDTKGPAFNSEPTELERQREMSNLRLKKAFGLPIDKGEVTNDVLEFEKSKSALSLKSILSCEYATSALSRKLPLKVQSLLGSELSSTYFPFTSRNSPTYPSITTDDSTTTSSHTITSFHVCETVDSTQEPSESFTSPVSNALNSEINLANDPTLTEITDISASDVSKPCSQNVCTSSNNVELETELHAVNVEDKLETEQNVLECTNVARMLDFNPEMASLSTNPVITESAICEKQDDPIVAMADYVPPFNNPIYPSDQPFVTSYSPTTVENSSKYEGRNPSPPPHYGSNNLSDTDKISIGNSTPKNVLVNHIDGET